jgi:hypothetical protein
MACIGEFLISQKEALDLVCLAIANPINGLEEDHNGQYVISSIYTEPAPKNKRQYKYTLELRDNPNVQRTMFSDVYIDPSKYYNLI